MITLNYQTFGKSGFQLRLRLYLNGETKFVNVTRNLKGTIKKAHIINKKRESRSSLFLFVERISP